MRRIIPYIVLLFVTVAACRTKHMGHATWYRVGPPPLQLPPSGNKIAIIDRCREHEKQRTRKDTTGGIIYQYGVLECLQYADTALQEKSSNYYFVPYNVQLKGARFAGEMPDALTPRQVDSLCTALQADQLIVLEAYKADYKINYFKVKSFENITNNYGGIEQRERTDFEYYADFKVNLTWAFYTRAAGRETGRLSQEQRVKHELTRYFSGGYAPGDKDLRQNVGRMMGRRITAAHDSAQVKIDRYYYSNDDPVITAGADYARKDNWKAALSEWRPLAESTKRNAGKACYNMAVGAERLGNYELALLWLGKAEAKKLGSFDAYRKELEQLAGTKK
jgi:hypothetical protein